MSRCGLLWVTCRTDGRVASMASRMDFHTSFVVALFGYKTCGRSSPLNRTPCMCLEWSNLYQTFCIHWIISLPGFILKEHKWKSMALQIHWPNVSNNHIIDALPSSIIVTMKTYLCLWTVLLRFLKEAVSNSKVEGFSSFAPTVGQFSTSWERCPWC